jgi:hypothetical protein
MRHKYTVIAEMTIKDCVVLTLDSPRRDDDFLSDYIMIDGRKLSYQLTHGENLIIVKGSKGFLNKELTFC